jgi:hypothetical protein
MRSFIFIIPISYISTNPVLRLDGLAVDQSCFDEEYLTGFMPPTRPPNQTNLRFFSPVIEPNNSDTARE